MAMSRWTTSAEIDHCLWSTLSQVVVVVANGQCTVMIIIELVRVPTMGLLINCMRLP